MYINKKVEASWQRLRDIGDFFVYLFFLIRFKDWPLVRLVVRGLSVIDQLFFAWWCVHIKI